MLARLIAFTTIASALTVSATAQVPMRYGDWTDIDYHGKITQLCDSHLVNHRVRGTHKVWEPTRALYKESKFFPADQEDILSARVWCTTFTRKTSSGDSAEAVYWLTPDARYVLSTEGKKRPYKLGEFGTEWKEPKAFATGFAAFLATKQIYNVQEGEQLDSHDKVDYEGQSALRLVTTKSDGIKTTIYLDRDSFQLLYFETDKSPMADERGKPGPEKTVTRVHYRDVGGKKYPTRYEQNRVVLV